HALSRAGVDHLADDDASAAGLDGSHLRPVAAGSPAGADAGSAATAAAADLHVAGNLHGLLRTGAAARLDEAHEHGGGWYDNQAETNEFLHSSHDLTKKETGVVSWSLSRRPPRC